MARQAGGAPRLNCRVRMTTPHPHPFLPPLAFRHPLLSPPLPSTPSLSYIAADGSCAHKRLASSRVSYSFLDMLVPSKSHDEESKKKKSARSSVVWDEGTQMRRRRMVWRVVTGVGWRAWWVACRTLRGMAAGGLAFYGCRTPKWLCRRPQAPPPFWFAAVIGAANEKRGSNNNKNKIQRELEEHTTPHEVCACPPRPGRASYMAPRVLLVGAATAHTQWHQATAD